MAGYPIYGAAGTQKHQASTWPISAVHRPIFQPFSATKSSPLKKSQSSAPEAKLPKGKEKSPTPGPASPAADESSEPIDAPLLAGAHWGHQVRFIYISPSVWFPRESLSLTPAHIRHVRQWRHLRPTDAGPLPYTALYRYGCLSLRPTTLFSSFSE